MVCSASSGQKQKRFTDCCCAEFRKMNSEHHLTTPPLDTHISSANVVTHPDLLKGIWQNHLVNNCNCINKIIARLYDIHHIDCVWLSMRFMRKVCSFCTPPHPFLSLCSSLFPLSFYSCFSLNHLFKHPCVLTFMPTLLAYFSVDGDLSGP